ncbi:MAG: hypothetical protein WC000_12460, partial [Dokdonella sp.]
FVRSESFRTNHGINQVDEAQRRHDDDEGVHGDSFYRCSHAQVKAHSKAKQARPSSNIPIHMVGSFRSRPMPRHTARPRALVNHIPRQVVLKSPAKRVKISSRLMECAVMALLQIGCCVNPHFSPMI